jgi:hypothetical protein
MRSCIVEPRIAVVPISVISSKKIIATIIADPVCRELKK